MQTAATVAELPQRPRRYGLSQAIWQGILAAISVAPAAGFAADPLPSTRFGQPLPTRGPWMEPTGQMPLRPAPNYLQLVSPGAAQVGSQQPPTRQPVAKQGYAYGWFGAVGGQPPLGRHFGYYRRYTQWSRR